MMDRESLSEWAKDKPLSILQLDPADRAVLRIAAILHRRRSIIMR
ncbi:GM20245 [Drosophila sechellia]|nr:GM20245 [Drosophila sechellia]